MARLTKKTTVRKSSTARKAAVKKTATKKVARKTTARKAASKKAPAKARKVDPLKKAEANLKALTKSAERAKKTYDQFVAKVQKAGVRVEALRAKANAKAEKVAAKKAPKLAVVDNKGETGKSGAIRGAIAPAA